MGDDKKQAPDYHDMTNTPESGPCPGMARKKKSPKLKRERDELAVRAGQNLWAIRKALGLRQADVARDVGVGQNAYSNWEKGKTCIDAQYANRLMDKSGIDIAWIYRSNMRPLPGDIREKLIEFLSTLEPDWRDRWNDPED